MLGTAQSLLVEPTDQRWVTFASSRPDATIFHHPAWITLLADCYGYQPFVIVLCDMEGQVRAGLPVMEVNSPLARRRWVSLPFTDFCSPLYCCPENQTDLANGMVTLARQSNVAKLEVRSALPSHPDWQGCTDFVQHTLPLVPDAEAVAGNFHRTQRQNIRTAEKNGVVICMEQDEAHLREFYQLQLQTRRRQGVPAQPWRFFELILTRLIKRDLGFILLGYKDGECLAGGLFLHWQNTLTYKYAASKEDSRNLRANHLLTWTAMRWACKNGYQSFDFGRTDAGNEGLRTFKNRWGAVETPLVYSVSPAQAVKPSHDRLMRVANTIIRNTPPLVCQLAGEVLYKYLA